MRPRIIGLDVDAMAWEPLGPPGLFSKLLSRDPDSGARTALQRMDPALGYAAPTVAHFHTTYEEILGVAGRFTFDQRTWVVPGAYVFHPERTVHGFASQVPQESLFLSRIGRQLDVNLVHEPIADDLYVIEGETPRRPPVAFGDAVAARGWHDAELLGRPVRASLLSQDPETGEGTAIVQLPAGWAADSQTRADYLEIFVLDGAVSADGAPAVDGRSYFFLPPGEPVPAFVARRDSRAYINFGSALA